MKDLDVSSCSFHRTFQATSSNLPEWFVPEAAASFFDKLVSYNGSPQPLIPLSFWRFSHGLGWLYQCPGEECCRQFISSTARDTFSKPLSQFRDLAGLVVWPVTIQNKSSCGIGILRFIQDGDLRKGCQLDRTPGCVFCCLASRPVQK